MRRYRRISALLVALACLPACVATGTKILESWAAPAAGRLAFSKVVAVCICKDSQLRRTVEDGMVRNIEMYNTKAVAAYAALSDQDLRDIQKAKEDLRPQGFDGAVVGRFADLNAQSAWVPGAYPNEFYSLSAFYGASLPLLAGPSYTPSSGSFRIQVNVYSIRDEKLMWSGQSETLSPASIPDLIDAVSKAVAGDLKRHGLIK